MSERSEANICIVLDEPPPLHQVISLDEFNAAIRFFNILVPSQGICTFLKINLKSVLTKNNLEYIENTLRYHKTDQGFGFSVKKYLKKIGTMALDLKYFIFFNMAAKNVGSKETKTILFNNDN